MLGYEIRILQSTPVAARSRDQNGDWLAELPFVHVRPFDVLSRGSTYFEEEKDEASISRLYGGIHYRADIEMGKEHGKRIGGYTVRFARLDGADR